MKQLITFEAFKIFKQKSIYVMGLLIIVFSIITIPHFNTAARDAYKTYGGVMTQQKINQVNQKTAALTKLMQKQSGSVRLSNYNQNLYGILETFSEQINYQHLITKRIVALSQKSTPKAQLEKAMMQEIHLNIFRNTWPPYLTIDFVNTWGFVFSGVLILIGLSSIFTREYASGVESFILTSKLGRKTIVTAKIISSFIYTFCVVGTWVLFDVIKQWILMGSSGWGSPIQVLYKYYLSPYPFTMIQYFFIQIGTHLIGALGFTLFILLISALCRRTLTSFLISAIIFALPIVWISVLNKPSNWLIDISYTNIMKVQDLYMKFHAIDVAGRLVLEPFVVLGVSLLVSVLILIGLYRYIRGKELTA